MNRKLITVISLLMILPACIYKKNLKQTKTSLLTQARTEFSLPTVTEVKEFHKEKYPLSKNKAIEIAIKNNAELHAQLDKIGIAQADLYQAGLFTNPEVHTIFKIPTTPNAITNIEWGVDFTLSDLWTVPFSVDVSYAEFESISAEILSQIRTIILETHHAYLQCLKQKDLKQLAQQAYIQAEDLHNQVVLRQEFGYSTPIDINLSAAQTAHFKTEYLQQIYEFFAQTTHLKKLLGMPSDIQEVIFKPLSDTGFSIPSVKPLEEVMLTRNPEMIMRCWRLHKAKRQLTLEKARTLDEVKLGIDYERDFDGTKGVGPAFSLSMPFFDFNQAQRARARAEIEHAEQQLQATNVMLREQLYMLHEKLITLTQQQTIQESAIEAIEMAIAYGQEYTKKMQLNMVILLDLYLKLYQEKMKGLRIKYEILMTKAELENLVNTTIT